MNAFDPTAVLSQSEPSLLAAARARPLYLPTKPLTEATLCDWIAQALPGERMQYHQGLLLQDRSPTTSPFPPRSASAFMRWPSAPGTPANSAWCIW